MPDVLAAFHFLHLEDKAETIAPVGVLGASNHHLEPEALANFRGKPVLLFPHLDDSGRSAAREWARQLKDAGAARVTAFDFSGLAKADGTAGKDLADVCLIGADCFDGQPKFHHLLP